MKKWMLQVFISFSIIVCAVTSASAEEGAISKLSRGICNIVTAPFELFSQSKKTKDRDGSVAGMTYGFMKGIVMTGARAVVGVYEVATFPLPYPDKYSPIINDPVSFFPEPKKK